MSAPENVAVGTKWGRIPATGDGGAPAFVWAVATNPANTVPQPGHPHDREGAARCGEAEATDDVNRGAPNSASASPRTLLDRRLCYRGRISPSPDRCVSCNGLIALLKWIREHAEGTAPSGCFRAGFDHFASERISKRPITARRSVVGRACSVRHGACEESLCRGRARLGDSFPRGVEIKRRSRHVSGDDWGRPLDSLSPQVARSTS